MRRSLTHYAVSVLLGTFLAIAPIQAASSVETEEGLNAYSDGNFEKAYDHFVKAASAGDPKAQFYIGNMLFGGQGTDRDLSLAARYYELAALQGHSEAQVALATMYRSGAGVQRDYYKVLYWLEEAAMDGHPIAQLDLGHISETGDNGATEPNIDYAFRWYEMAARNGVVRAQAKLGQLYLGNSETPDEQALGYAWLTIAEGNAATEHREDIVAVREEWRGRVEETVLENASKAAANLQEELAAGSN